MQRIPAKHRRGLALSLGLGLVVATAMSGCSDNTAPGLQPEIANVADNFQFQTSSLHGVSGSWSYIWQNGGTGATVDQSCSIADGTALLVIRSPAGKQVYARDLAENGTFVTLGGTAGGWTIEVRFDRVTAAAINFRVQKQM